ncbi:MAG: YdcF family protein [Lachnospiraceae bacterium]|nr:YdcF family protein [Lachnospiraceae bacterium]
MNERLLGKMLKYDTTDKEPNLYDALVLSALAGLALAVMARGRVNIVIIALALDLYFLAMVALISSAYIRQLQCNPYSYNMIYYRGFGLFFLLQLVSCSLYSVQIMRNPGQFRLLDILLFLLDTEFTYVVLSTPAVLIFSAWLCVSNINLIKHEGKRFVNVLGIILSFMMIAGLAFIIYFGILSSWGIGPGSMHSFSIGPVWISEDLILNIVIAIYLYFECMLTGAIAAVFIVSEYEPRTDKDFIIILGCGLRKDGTPTPLLAGRVDRALEFYERQKAETGKGPIFITSGGQGPGEVISESASMKGYLLEKGIPAEQIIEEDKSTNTFENMKFSKEKIWAINPEAKVAFSTTNYHVFRSGLYARRLKMRAVGMGQPTKWWFWPNAAVREFVGLLTENKKKQALILGTIAGTYILLTLLAQR